MSGSTTNNTVIGSGSDSITLNMAEDQALGVDAEFTLNVDGQQIGGVQTVTASQSAGQTQAFTFDGNFAPGAHTVTASFVNNFIYPGVAGDRNLYVDSSTYDGQTLSSTTTPIYQTGLYPPNSTTGNNYGNAVFKANDTTSIPSGAPSTPTTTPAAVAVGSGTDTLALNMAEDPYLGDAQFTVSVDGKQVGGTQTTSAVMFQGQSQEFDVHGNFGSGTHTVSVDFLNDQIGGFYPGTQDALDTTDRNLYVMGMSLNGGPAASGAPWELSSNGTKDFTVTAGSNPSATTASSGLFATDGAAATSDNAAISSSSLSTGTATSGMTFVASPTTTPSSTDTTGTTTDTTAPIAAVASGTTQSSQDFAIPSATSSSDTATTGSTGSSSNWWTMHQQANVAGSTSQHHS
jgi:predicted xylan-binding protein with Ca-dependent carbohydrate-binding module